jgi:hypothetical protein
LGRAVREARPNTPYPNRETNMASIIIQGIKPYDGEYDLVTDRAFNAREWRCIKKVSGYMPLTVSDGFAGGDPDLFVALAVVAMTRAGKVERERMLDVADELAEAPFDGAAITMVGDEEADNEVPLDSTPTQDEPSLPDLLSSVG